ncbi:MAG: cytochrome P450 [Chloroflexota bacterium]
MLATQEIDLTNFNGKVNLLSKEFINNKFAYYTWLRENDPVHRGRLSVIPLTFLTRYEDCVNILKDRRIMRNRTNAMGRGGRFPFPLPRSVQALMASMINEDDPEHRRLRTLVHKAFTPRHLAYLDARIEALTHELLDKAEAKGEIDLMQEYALPIPVTVIAEMVGVAPEEVPEFTGYITALTSGFSGFSLFRTFTWDLPKAIKFCKQLIERKRKNPDEDILTALIQAEEDGDQLTEDELIAMVFLIIVAGYETTVHLITNGVYTLLTHPHELQRLRENPGLMESAVEEINRFNGPIQATKLGYPNEDIEIQGVPIKRGTSIMPLLGAANHDPTFFENPEVFDIGRTPNRHLGFGQGIHYCLGAPLARIETRIALKNLLERNPNLRLAVDPNELKLQMIPGWHRYQTMPVKLK